MKLFALKSSAGFAALIAKELNISLTALEEREFEDGEHKSRSLENVRNQDVFVVHSLYSDTKESVNDKLCRLLFFIGSLKDASASKVTAVIPYLCYARKDRKTKSRDPVTTRYVARLLEAAGADAVVTVDVHNLQAFQNAFNIPAENIEARKILANYSATIINGESPVIMSPDFGGIKRAQQFQLTLSKKMGFELPIVFMEKYRSSDVVSGERVAGEVKGKTVIIVDDLVSTGGTLTRSAEACKRAGARKVLAMVTHGLFTGKAGEILMNDALEQIIITNTIQPFRLEHTEVKNKLTVLNVAGLIAEVIKRMQEGDSITELLED